MFQVRRLPDGSHNHFGRIDQAGRWRPNLLYQSLFTDAKKPSRIDPHSYLRHVYTLNFARRLHEWLPAVYCRFHDITEERTPRLFMDAMGIPEDSEEGMKIIARHTALRMQGRI